MVIDFFFSYKINTSHFPPFLISSEISKETNPLVNIHINFHDVIDYSSSIAFTTSAFCKFSWMGSPLGDTGAAGMV